MNIDEVYMSVHNLITREALRRFQPKYSILVVSPDDGVIKLEKYKLVPAFSEVDLLLEGTKGCGAFIASAEIYPTKEKLQDSIQSLQSKLRDKILEKEKLNRKRGLVGTTYYGGSIKS